MKLKNILLLLVAFVVCYACDDDVDTTVKGQYVPEEVISEEIKPVVNLAATYDLENGEAVITWRNPEDKYLVKVELSYKNVDEAQSKTIELPAESMIVERQTLPELAVGIYEITVVAINEIDIRSQARTVTLEITQTP